MEANMVEHMTYLARRIPGATVKDEPGLLLVDSGIPSNTFNVVCRARLRPQDADARISAAIGHFREKGFPFAWWVGPGAMPEDLETRLTAQGLANAEAEQGMAADLSRLPALTVPAGLDLRRVSTERELADVARVLAANWDPPDPGVMDFYARTARVALAPDSPVRFYVGYLDGVAVAASECFLAHGVAGLYSVATVKAARRRGIGTALTLAPLLDAREAGYRTATLQASADGQPVYARLGFEPCGAFREYQ
ncbi:GNAT family N-acetyltransferase [Pyxidicoccus fallax]|uniref:GNAT family N-acetyltransferase n=2 Tax=Pyxidicoccus fallax TaxID=394095 RepID=A0A848LM00_9BACT|nr:GNAT family N-acetyltransferase [Pyxidicoccus fallax]NMO18857.1 GNAT family N-acetyltransferase [Pyxidicoccus fallax]NPC83782.1 GNAT family N-acetyltransferase [Pyxidicoccus fallax]